MRRDTLCCVQIESSDLETQPASDVWVICQADAAEQSYNTHLIFKCPKECVCEEGIAWNLVGCREDYPHRFVSVVDPSDLLPLTSNEIKNQALALIKGSGKWWITKDISQTLGCNHELFAAHCNYC